MADFVGTLFMCNMQFIRWHINKLSHYYYQTSNMHPNFHKDYNIFVTRILYINCNNIFNRRDQHTQQLF